MPKQPRGRGGHQRGAGDLGDEIPDRRRAEQRRHDRRGTHPPRRAAAGDAASISRDNAAVLRVVFDTNVLLSLFAFRGSRFASLREAVTDGRVLCLTRADCLDELARVLRAPHLALDDGARAEAVTSYLTIARLVPDLPAPQSLPRCGDVDDQKFLELAVTAGASHLVTLDRALLALAPRVAPLRVVVPRRLSEALRDRG